MTRVTKRQEREQTLTRRNVRRQKYAGGSLDFSIVARELGAVVR